MKIITNDPLLVEYYEALQKHDWYYEYSDDHSVWANGSENYHKLFRDSTKSKQHEELWDSYQRYVLCGFNECIYKKPLVEYND
jgi:hypothetical protein